MRFNSHLFATVDTLIGKQEFYFFDFRHRVTKSSSRYIDKIDPSSKKEVRLKIFFIRPTFRTAGYKTPIERSFQNNRKFAEK